jgi:hypothetical protein
LKVAGADFLRVNRKIEYCPSTEAADVSEDGPLLRLNQIIQKEEYNVDFTPLITPKLAAVATEEETKTPEVVIFVIKGDDEAGSTEPNAVPHNIVI